MPNQARCYGNFEAGKNSFHMAIFTKFIWPIFWRLQPIGSCQLGFNLIFLKINLVSKAHSH
jgi:hypothetical protein